MVKLFGKIFSMQAPTEAQRGEAWRRMMAQTVLTAETMDRAGLVEAARMHRRSVDGGTCDRCGKPWDERRVDNRFARGRYFEPACRCFVWWETDPIKYRAICDKCHEGFTIDRHRRVLNAGEVLEAKARAQYERLVCPKCSGKGGKDVPDELR